MMGEQCKCCVCGEKFELETDLEVGDVIDCPACSAELKITKLVPIETEEVTGTWDDYGEEEDVYDDDDYGKKFNKEEDW